MPSARARAVGRRRVPTRRRARAFEALVKRGWLVSACVDDGDPAAEGLIGLSSEYLDALRALATARAPVCPAPARRVERIEPAPADASAPAGAPPSAPASNGLCAEFWRQCEAARADGESDDQPLVSVRAHHGGSVAVLFDTLASGRYELQPKFRAPPSASARGVTAGAGTGDMHLVDFLDDSTANGPCSIDVVRRLDRTSAPAVSEGVGRGRPRPHDRRAPLATCGRDRCEPSAGARSDDDASGDRRDGSSDAGRTTEHNRQRAASHDAPDRDGRATVRAVRGRRAVRRSRRVGDARATAGGGGGGGGGHVRVRGNVLLWGVGRVGEPVRNGKFAAGSYPPRFTTPGR